MNRSCLVTRVLAGVGLTATLASAPVAHAESSPPIDVVLPVEAVPQRVVSVAWNPLALFISKISADVVIAPGDHHAIVVSPFYAWPSTVSVITPGTDFYGQPVNVAGCAPGVSTAQSGMPAPGPQCTIPSQSFTGFGAELGYRYYTGRGGPRGFFAGPSLILAAMTATAGDNSKTSYLDYGLAIDAGYGALVADRVAITLGVGAQYSRPSTTIPPQQFPAAIYANAGIFPRLLVGVGYGF
jgi:hypothetical protein